MLTKSKLSVFHFQKKYIFFVFVVFYLIMCQSCVKMRMNSKETKAFFEKSKTKFLDKTISFQDFTIHFVETGDVNKPSLYFIHGSPGSWDAFKRYLKDSLLLEKYRLIAIDRPGFGYSDFGKAQNLQTQSDRIHELILKIGNGQPIILVGHSLGGPLVAKLATDFPTMFSNVVILSGALDPAAESPEKWRSILMSKPLRYLIPGALRPSNDELWWLKTDLINLKPHLKNIVANVTIIHGTKDRLVPFSNVKFMTLFIENAKKIKIIPIENADHFIPWTHYEIVRDAILNLKI